MWTQFWDMHSGGGAKLWRQTDGRVSAEGGMFYRADAAKPVEKIYIEASEKEAVRVFYNRFRRNPHRVTCTCCGDDYSVSEGESLEQLTAYHRGCAFKTVKGEDGGGHYAESPSKDYRGKSYMTLDQYTAQSDVLVIRADEILPAERGGEVPEQGYVWRD